MMHELLKAVGCGLACLTVTAAAAEDSNADRLCSERPGLTTSACITAPGRLQTETALAGWTLERQDGERRDTILLGDTLVRYGIGGKTELRVEWTPYGAERDRGADHSVSHAHRVGDATIGVKTSLVERQGDNGLALSAIASAMRLARYASQSAGVAIVCWLSRKSGTPAQAPPFFETM